MKKTRNHTFTLLTLVGLIFMLDSCESIYVQRNRPIAYRRVPPTKVVVVKRYGSPPRPVRSNVRIRF